MGVVERCKKELENCKEFCRFQAMAIANSRLERQRYYVHCVKRLCEPSYDKCLDQSPLGRLLAMLA